MNKKGLIGIVVVIVLLVVVILLLIGLISVGLLVPTGKIIGGLDDDSVSGPQGKVVMGSKIFDISDFDSVKLVGNFNLFLTDSDSFDVKITADSDVFDKLEVRQQGKTLVIERNRYTFLSKKIDVFLTMPELKDLEVLGSGDIVSENTLTGDDLKISILGSGKSNVNIKYNTLFSNIAGSGTLTYSGDVKDHEIKISGSGNIKAFDLISENTNIGISGSGNSDVNVNDELDITISGSGNVKYKGNPKVKQSVSGFGNIEQV
ncbi:DUF2807 domain-containing protein [Candidatus Pacearchaeota archaeon]|nr:DUF2807 domain-containing protein [Candidatus Pacearchaeota archaeon]